MYELLKLFELLFQLASASLELFEISKLQSSPLAARTSGTTRAILPAAKLDLSKKSAALTFLTSGWPKLPPSGAAELTLTSWTLLTWLTKLSLTTLLSKLSILSAKLSLLTAWLTKLSRLLARLT